MLLLQPYRHECHRFPCLWLWPVVMLMSLANRNRKFEKIKVENEMLSATTYLSHLNSYAHKAKLNGIWTRTYLGNGDLVNVFVHIVRVSYTYIVVRVLVMDWPVCLMVSVLLWFYLFQQVPTWGSSLMRPFVKIWKKATVKRRNIISLIGWGYTGLWLLLLFLIIFRFLVVFVFVLFFVYDSHCIQVII